MSNNSNPRPAWYDYVLAIIPFILVLVWGNSVYLCTIIPYDTVYSHSGGSGH